MCHIITGKIMKCRTIHKKLIFFLEDELRKEEMDGIKIHLKECAECAAFAAEMQKTLGIIRTEKISDINPFIYTRLKAKLENTNSDQKTIKQQPVYLRILHPVVVGIVMIAGIYAGVKIGHAPYQREIKMMVAEQGLVPFFDEMKTEPIENYLIEQDGNEQN